MKRSRRLFSAVTVVVATFVCLGALAAAQSQVYRSLPRPDSSNFRPLDQITKANVGQLEVAWFYPYGAATFSPVYARDVLYGLGRNNTSLVALDAATGKEIWVHDGLNGINGKGINYWESEDGKDRRLIFSVDSFLQADRRAHGQVDSDVRRQRHRRHARRACCAPRARACARSRPVPGRIWRNTHRLRRPVGRSRS